MTVKIITLFSLILLISACSEAQSERRDSVSDTENNSKINVAIEVSEFKTFAKLDGIQIIDVRTKEEFDKGNFPNSINIDFYGDDFKTKLSKLNREKKTLIYCHSAGRSGKAAKLMYKLNFKEVYDLIGGYSKSGL